MKSDTFANKDALARTNFLGGGATLGMQKGRLHLATEGAGGCGIGTGPEEGK